MGRAAWDIELTDWALAAFVAAVAGAAAYARILPGVCGTVTDDAMYMVTAKAIAGGQGYTLISLPEPVAQTKYPPLYPLLLSALWCAQPSFPANLRLVETLSVAATATAGALSYLYLAVHRYGNRAALVLALLLATTGLTFSVTAAQALSEMPFLVLSLVALWRLEDRRSGGSSSSYRALTTGVLLGLPMLCRSIGVMLLPVVVWRFWRDRRQLAAALTGWGLVVMPWLTWVGMLTGSRSDVLELYYVDYVRWFSSLGWQQLAATASLNFALLLAGTTSLAVEGLAGDLLRVQPDLWTLLVVTGAVVWTIITFLAVRESRPAPLYLVSYALLVCAWPWPPGRFLVPILPLALGTAAGQLEHVFTRTAWRWAAGALALGAVVLNVYYLSSMAHYSTRHRFPYNGTVEQPVHWTSFEQAFDWVRANTHDGDVVATGLDGMLFLYTGRKAFNPFAMGPGFHATSEPAPILGTTVQLWEALASRRTAYVLDAPLPAYPPAGTNRIRAMLSELADPGSGRLVRVYVGSDDRFVVYRVRTVADSQRSPR